MAARTPGTHGTALLCTACASRAALRRAFWRHSRPSALSDEKDELALPTNGLLVKRLDEVEQLHQNGARGERAGRRAAVGSRFPTIRAVRAPREQAMDTQVLVVLASIGLQMAKGLSPEALTRVMPGELVARLKSKYASGSGFSSGEPLPAEGFDWAALGRSVRGIFRYVPSSGPHMCVRRRRALCARSSPLTAAPAGWAR